MEVQHGLREILGKMLLHLDLVHPEVVGLQLERFLDDAVETEEPSLRRMLAGEGEKVLDDLRHAAGLGVDGLQAPLALRSDYGAHEHVAVAHDGRQGVVDLVGHPGDQLAKGGHLLSLEQLIHRSVQSLVSFLQSLSLRLQTDGGPERAIGNGGRAAPHQERQQGTQGPEDAPPRLEAVRRQLIPGAYGDLPGTPSQGQPLHHRHDLEA